MAKWTGVLARFDKPTVDGRKLAKPKGDVPLHVDAWLREVRSTHQLGTVTRAWVDGDLLRGEGLWTYKPPPAGAGVSVGLDLHGGDWIRVHPQQDLMPGVDMIMYGWQIMGLTAYVQGGEPAFPDAQIEVLDA